MRIPLSHLLCAAASAVLSFACHADELNISNAAGGDLDLKQLAGHRVYLADTPPELFAAEQALLKPYHPVFTQKEQAEVVVSTQYMATFSDPGGKPSGDDAKKGNPTRRFHLKKLQCLGSSGGGLLAPLVAAPTSPSGGTHSAVAQASNAQSRYGAPIQTGAEFVVVLLEAGFDLLSRAFDAEPKPIDCEQSYTQCPLSAKLCGFSEIAVTTAETIGGKQDAKRYRWVTYKKQASGVDSQQVLDKHIHFLRQGGVGKPQLLD